MMHEYYPSFYFKEKDDWPTHRRTESELSLHMVQYMKEINYLWTANEADFQNVTFPGVEAFAQIKGHLLVPRSFCIPETAPWPTSTYGYKLGLAVNTLRIHKGINIARDNLLRAIGFVWDPTRFRFEKTMLPACQMYIQEHGGTLMDVPQSFRVSRKATVYPVACRGYYLGKCLYLWRMNGARADLLEELKKLGFHTDPIVFSQQDLSFLLTGLEWFHLFLGYKERIAKKFCLPSDHPSLPGLPLGQLFFRAKKWNEKVGFLEHELKQLEVFATWNSVYQSTIFPLMEIYFNLHGDLHIPNIFPIPACDPWPIWSWLQQLGAQTQSIRQGGMSLFEEEKDTLDSMHFKWGPKGRTPIRENKRQKTK